MGATADADRHERIVYGQPPDMTRPLSDLADEIMAAVAWMSPAATKEAPVGQRDGDRSVRGQRAVHDRR